WPASSRIGWRKESAPTSGPVGSSSSRKSPRPPPANCSVSSYASSKSAPRVFSVVGGTHPQHGKSFEIKAAHNPKLRFPSLGALRSALFNLCSLRIGRPRGIESRFVELRHVRYFIAVAEYLNVRKAAEQLHIAQPPLSRQIRQLEEDLGVALFVRNTHRVELTRAGHAFLEQARKLVVQAGHAAEAARHAQKGESGIVRIGLASGLGGAVSKVVLDHRRRRPMIDIECKDIFSSPQNEAIQKGIIDIGFLRPPVDQLNLDCELLFEEEFVVVMPKSHRLAKRRVLKLKDVADEPLILFDRTFSSG